MYCSNVVLNRSAAIELSVSISSVNCVFMNRLPINTNTIDVFTNYAQSNCIIYANELGTDRGNRSL